MEEIQMQDYMNKLHAAADYIREKVGEAEIFKLKKVYCSGFTWG